MNLENLIEEVKEVHYIKDGNVQPQYELFNSLQYPLAYQLSDDEYKKRTLQLLSYSDTGSFDLGSYLTVFHFLTRFDNPFHFDVAKLETRIKRGMNKSRSNQRYIPFLEQYLTVIPGSDYVEILDRLQSHAIEINNSLEKKELQKIARQNEEIFYSNFEEFLKQFIDNKKILHEPVFANFRATRFWKHFANSSNHHRWRLIALMNDRLRYCSPMIKPEISFFIELNQKSAKSYKKNQKQPSHFLFGNFHDITTKIVTTLNSH